MAQSAVDHVVGSDPRHRSTIGRSMDLRLDVLIHEMLVSPY